MCLHSLDFGAELVLNLATRLGARRMRNEETTIYLAAPCPNNRPIIDARRRPPVPLLVEAGAAEADAAERDVLPIAAAGVEPVPIPLLVAVPVPRLAAA